MLCDQVNAALQVMAADGTLAEISDKWFGTDITTVTPDENALDGMDIQPRTFILGLDDSFPPMGFRDTETNEIVVFDIDVATAMCEMLDWELQVQPIDWASNTMELNAGNVDCLWNGMTLTEERLEAMSCSIPYMENEQVLVVMSDSGIQSKADLAGKTLALQAGSSAEEALESDTEFMNSLGSINRFEDNMLALMDLEQGSSDTVLVDSIVANTTSHPTSKPKTSRTKQRAKFQFARCFSCRRRQPCVSTSQFYFPRCFGAPGSLWPSSF